jgi:hypothetical protein
MRKKFFHALNLILFFTILSCQKDQLQPPSEQIFAKIQSLDLTVVRVDDIKAGNSPYAKKFSDTMEAARNGFGTVLEGNSQIERMIYSNWDLNFKKWRFVNRGIGGTRWDELIRFTQKLVTDYRPSNIIVYSGENEYSQNLNLSSPRNIAYAGFKKFMDSVRSQNKYARVYVFSMLTCPKFYYRGFSNDIDTLNMMYKNYIDSAAIALPNKWFYIDIRSLYPSTVPSKWETDSIHVKVAEYPAWFAAIKANIDTTRILIPIDTIRTDTIRKDTIPVTIPTDIFIPPPPPPPITVVTTPPPPPPLPGAPIAIAEANQATHADTIVVVKSTAYNPYVYGTRSKDPDGWVAKFQWSYVSGPPSYTIVSPNTGNTKLIDLNIGTYIFRLTVTDNKGLTSFDDVTVIMK